jgi:hypothetical protein
VVWQRPDGHPARDVGVLSDTVATAQDKGGGTDLEDEVVVEEVAKTGVLAKIGGKEIFQKTWRKRY